MALSEVLEDPTRDAPEMLRKFAISHENLTGFRFVLWARDAAAVCNRRCADRIPAEGREQSPSLTS